MGTYINDSTDDSFILTDAFQLTNISVMHAVYGNEVYEDSFYKQ